MAGLLGGLMGWGNQDWYKAFDQNRRAIGGFGAGLGMGVDPQQGLALGTQNALQGAQWDQQERQRQDDIAKEQETRNKTAAWLRGQPGGTMMADWIDMGAVDGSTALSAWLGGQKGEPVKGIEINGKLVNPFTGELMGDFSNAGSGVAEISLQPQWGIGPDGKPVLGQLSKDGVFVPTAMPDGVSAMDPRTLAGERAYGTEDGKRNAEAIAAAPQAIVNAETMMRQIDELYNDPGLWWSVGGLGGTPNWPGNPTAGTISRIEQLQGQTFLQAFQSLKGGGQITEVEGEKATNAIGRLQRSQNYDDYRQALKDLRDIVATGLERARQQAAGTYVPGEGIVPSTGGADAYDKYGLER